MRYRKNAFRGYGMCLSTFDGRDIGARRFARQPGAINISLPVGKPSRVEVLHRIMGQLLRLASAGREKIDLSRRLMRMRRKHPLPVR